jgi:DNA-binding protein H-NS
MTTLAELIKQKEALDAQIASTRQTELADAISKVKALVAEHGLTQKDVFGSSKGTKKSSGRSKVAAKYRDPSSGQTWSGRGKEPKWIDGQERSKFLIA